MDGLEQAPWAQCEQLLLETESRIVDEFSLKQPLVNRNIVYTLVGLLASAVFAGWYFSSGPETVDLSNSSTEAAAPLEKDPEAPKSRGGMKLPDLDSLNTEPTPIEPEALENEVQEPINVPDPKPQTPIDKVEELDEAAVHIAVGRIIDVKGIAISNASVKSGNVSDTTDNYGYFALKVPKGGAKIIVTHLATEYPIEIDTNQNWEIVLDIAARKVHDYSPMNAANRFK